MKRLAFIAAAIAIVGGIFWTMVSELDHAPSGRDEPPAVILRAPEGFEVEEIGAATFEGAAAALNGVAGDRVGIKFSNDGDTVILLADRSAQKIVELRASRTGTIVERVWPGEIDRRLAWAIDNGNLDVPDLPPATGKNLYH
jgi:hypothetical protein